MSVFKDEDLRAEVEEEFAELQERFEEGARRDLLDDDRAGHSSLGSKPSVARAGFRVISVVAKPKSDFFKAHNRRYMMRREMADIMQRLAAGELPPWRPGKPGRKPKRWLTAAAALGIDLEARCRAADPVPAKKTIRERLLAGELPTWRPGAFGRPPTRWIKAAAELGIDLSARCAAATSAV